MKNPLIPLVAASVILSGCIGMSLSIPWTQADSAKTDKTDDVAAIRKLYADNAAALSAGDLSAMAKWYESDAIQLPPNSPALIGWDAIGSTLKGELEGITVAATIEVVEVCTADHWAFARGRYRMVTTPQGGGDEEVTIGNWLDILRRQPDNSWKIARSSWSTGD